MKLNVPFTPPRKPVAFLIVVIYSAVTYFSVQYFLYMREESAHPGEMPVYVGVLATEVAASLCTMLAVRWVKASK